MRYPIPMTPTFLLLSAMLACYTTAGPCTDYCDYICECHADDGDLTCDDCRTIYTDDDAALSDECETALTDQQAADDAAGVDCSAADTAAAG